jgi:3-(3-hydroxy-phenyl)propionate hydroxylase
LQQYTVEEILIERLKELGGSVRWCSKLESFEDHGDHVALRIETPDGPYAMSTDWLIACDGAKSHVRRSMGLSFEGQVFQDRFLIVDAKMDVERPLERWFWFEPPFHEGQTVLLHRQPGDVWRVDFQLSGDIDEAAEKDPERIRARLAAMFGEDVSFDLEWVSIYAFQCRTLERYVHNRIVFCGDSAHQVSPFGARGGNGGTQDADNLGWKLAAILKGEAPEGLLETYQMERKQAALENIGHSTRATDFMTPKSHASRIIRDEVLDMAKAYGFAKALINSGRLSRPCSLTDSPLSTPDDPAFEGGLPPGSPAADAPIRVSGKEAWFLEQLQGQFTLVHWGSHASAPDVSASPLPMRVLCVGSGEDIEDTDGLLAKRYGAHDGTAYLFRPDQHVAARWREAAGADVPGSVRLALGYSLQLGEQSLKAAA